MSDTCCKKFEDALEDSTLERDADGSYNVNGCCGGGCYVLSEVNYCPYCGTKLTLMEGE
jgi:hypothetical protein